ncbi:sensor histidine kinase [Xylanibacillus composti]|nr:sensor histidine kinase [Xylanibacillus composti]
MLILYFSCVFLPIVLTNIIFYNVTTGNVQRQRTQDIMRAVEQMKNEFLNEVEDAVSVSTVFNTDHLLNEILETKYDNPVDYIEAYDSYLRRVLNSYGPIYYSLKAITVYVDNPTMLYAGGIAMITPETKETDWYKAIQENPSSRPIFIRTGSDGMQDTYSVVRKMDNYVPYNEREKILKIDLDSSAIRRIFGNLNLQGDIYLLNDQGRVEYTTDHTVNWEEGHVFYDNIIHAKDAIEFQTDAFTVGFLDKWRVIGIVEESEVFEEVRKSRGLVIVLACINSIIPTAMIVWITRSLHVRLGLILRHMKKVKIQNFALIKQAETRDEIGQLTGEFNRMTEQIKNLINDVYVADIQKKSLELKRRQAQLHALQSQINPHFLFNALETIRMRSLMKKETETAKIIHHMAKIFRNSLVWSKDMTSVREEMEFIHCFLEIQKYRFGDRLTYHVQADDEALSCMIPKLTFLPFVENASIHGIEPLKSGGLIDIHIFKESEHIVFTLKDNGVGMDDQKLEQLQKYIESEPEMGDRIGIPNVIYRLKLYYGKEFDIRLDSIPEIGTRVLLRIPIAGQEGGRVQGE